MLRGFTDYPLLVTDEPHKPAPIRRIEIGEYDEDKYVEVFCEGSRFIIKTGYVYEHPGRCGEVKCISVDKLLANNKTIKT